MIKIEKFSEVLLHTCCAPCSIKCIDTLEQDGYKTDFFWYNPNIHPLTEYKSRRDTLLEFAKSRDIKVILENEYGLKKFILDIYPEFDKKRCENCYQMRLEKTAKFASENSYKYFSTTLLISPYQNHDLIKDICLDLSKKYQIEFLYKDFRPYFREGQRIARESGMYMQKYCGCIFSEEERYINSLCK